MKKELTVITHEIEITEENLDDVARATRKFEGLNNAIQRSITNIHDSFISISVNMHELKHKELFKIVGYKDIYDYAFSEYGLGKTSTKNFISIAEKACIEDEEDNNLRQSELKEEYKNFGYSQIVELISLDEVDLDKYNPEMSVREIRRNKVKDKIEEQYKSMIDLENENSEVNKIFNHFKNKYPGLSLSIYEVAFHSYLGQRFIISIENENNSFYDLHFGILFDDRDYTIFFTIEWDRITSYDEFIIKLKDKFSKIAIRYYKDLEIEEEKLQKQTHNNDINNDLETEEDTYIELDETSISSTGTAEDFVGYFHHDISQDFCNKFIEIFKDFEFEWDEKEEIVYIYLSDYVYLTFKYCFENAYYERLEEYFLYKFKLELRTIESDELIQEFTLIDLFKQAINGSIRYEDD